MKKDEKPTVEAKTTDTLSFIKSEMVKVKSLSLQLDEKQKPFIRGLVNKDLSDTELLMFLSFANKLQLNPFTKEVIAIVYYKNDPNKRSVSTVVTRDGKRTVAQRTNELDGISSEAIYIKEIETPIYELDAKTGETKDKAVKVLKEFKKVEAWQGGTLWGATAVVTRKGKQFTVTVPFKEYTTNANLWVSKPSTMIKKVAESQALSAAFPEILSGVYDETEMSMPAESGKVLPVSTDDEKPATEQQINTIKALDSTKMIPVDITFGEAKQTILDLSQKKTKKGEQT